MPQPTPAPAAHFKGSLGDSLCLLPVLEAMGRRHGARVQADLWRMGELLRNNPHAEATQPRTEPVIFRHQLPEEAREHLVDFFARLAGVEVLDRCPRLYLDEADAVDIQAALAEHVRSRPLVAMDPQAGWPSREWGLRHFEGLARTLRSEGFAVVQVGAPFHNCYGHAVDMSMDGMDASFYGALSIRQTAFVLSRAACFVGNDSGLAHLAAAVQTPAVTLFGPVHPLTRAHEWTLPVFEDACPNWRAMHTECTNNRQCMRAIRPQEVARLVRFAAAHRDQVSGASRRMLRELAG